VKAKGDIVSRDVEELTEARRKDVKADFNAGPRTYPNRSTWG
jgi:hypothetical protein